jgi:uncharacterized membrane protein YoaK (UPF0700 family)
MSDNITKRFFLAGGFFLTMVAGQVNVISYTGVYSQTVSHLTGTVTHLSSELLKAQWISSFQITLIIVHFLAGSAVSGFVTGIRSLRMGRRYGVLLMLEGFVLTLSMIYLQDGALYGEYLAAFACGLQNAMASSFSGAVLRTTHMTGIITDLGILIGHSLRHGNPDLQRFLLYLSLLSGFITGGILGSLAYISIGILALLIPAGMTFSAGLIYFVWRHLFYSDDD